MSLSIPVCTSCGEATFPAVLLCPSCGGGSWRYEAVETGVLEGCTVRDGVGVGLVRIPLGPLAIARVEGGLEVGCEVALSQDSLVPVAEPL